MRNLIGIVFILSLFIVYGCGGDAKDAQSHNHENEQRQTMTKDTEINKSEMTCPVSNEPIENLDHYVEYEGETYYFCCDKCKGRFTNNPERYIKKETSLSEPDSEGYYTIKLPTAVCGMCVNTISKAVNTLNGIENIVVNVDDKYAKVKFDASKTSLSSIRTAISKAGYDADDVIRDRDAYNSLHSCCKFENEAHS